MRRAVGLDFGTTNSAVAVTAGDGEARLAEYATAGGATRTFRSILFFQPARVGPPRVAAGPEAIQAYLEADEPGRLVQSLKSYLASPGFRGTRVFDKGYKVEELLALLLGRLREAAERQLGDLGRRVVVGRPVRFVDGDDPERDALAVTRLAAALRLAGFDQPTFVHEPVAAAHGYRRRLTRAERALIADFGGGTTDLSLVELSPPEVEPGVRILATGGVAVAGDCFDGRLVQHGAAPVLGAGSHYRSTLGRELPVPAWLYTSLRRWHHVSFLKERKTLDMLAEIARTSDRREAIGSLRHLIEHDLGFSLHGAVQRCKNTLTLESIGPLVLSDGPLELDGAVAREDFEAWITPELEVIDAAVAEVLNGGSTRPAEVDAVFLTGGSSLVPVVRQRFADRFGGDRLRGGEELTTVALGLAMHGDGGSSMS